MPEFLAEPFTGLWNRRGAPILDGGIRLSDLLGRSAQPAHAGRKSATSTPRRTI